MQRLLIIFSSGKLYYVPVSFIIVNDRTFR